MNRKYSAYHPLNATHTASAGVGRIIPSLNCSDSTTKLSKVPGFSPGGLSKVLGLGESGAVDDGPPKLRLFPCDVFPVRVARRPSRVARALRGGRQRQTIAAVSSLIDHIAGSTLCQVKSGWILRNWRRMTEMATILSGNQNQPILLFMCSGGPGGNAYRKPRLKIPRRYSF